MQSLATGAALSTGNVIVAGTGGVGLALSAAVAQLAFYRVAPWLGAAVGAVALAAGMMLVVTAAADDSGATFVAGVIIGGMGFGVAFLSGLRRLGAVIPPEHRAGVMSAFYVVAYSALSVPAVIAGIVVTHLGLQTTFETFGSIVAAIALVVAAEAWRTRPAAV